MFNHGFTLPLEPGLAAELSRRAHEARGSILTATSASQSGHPGGSMSSIEIYTVLYSCARVRPEEPHWPSRDRIVISHGHTSPGVYSALANAGFFDVAEFEAHFRQAGSPFEGHVERAVAGVEWSTGNLGQGLSAGVGMALGARLSGRSWRTFVVMSDGEQQKGQVAEARRLAVRQNLTDLTVIIDMNGIQISGRTEDVMPVDVAAGFAADGWRVVHVDGHDIKALHSALTDAEGPTCIIANTHIGQGVSFMRDKPEFHGRGLTAEEYMAAMGELGIPPRLIEARNRRALPCAVLPLDHATPAVRLIDSQPASFGSFDNSDNRSAWGAALVDIARANPQLPIAVLDCDLAVSVKTESFAHEFPHSFIQCGVGEHNAATVGGALSTCDVLTFWADFGAFGCDEVYNQQRL
ncbi:MAG: thiamine pyrophosphate-dependent enzyme, partial [Coriobacteriia bacterium]|nr:thiamine pyrophosphate-dependent enzyme [Coriobacteriia bacterium]